MQIGTCLVSCDLNPLYLDFFPAVHKAWTEMMEINVKLILIGEEIPKEYQRFSSDIVVFPPVQGVNTAFQAQCIRLLYPSLIEEGERGSAVIISDMDIIPMNSSYFVNSIAHLPDDKFALYRGNILIRDSAQVAICYNAASPKTWSEIFGGINDVVDVRRKLEEWAALCPEYDGTHGGKGWSFDQRILFDTLKNWCVNESRRERIAVLTDSETGYCRLDRLDLMRSGRFTAEQAEMVRKGAYSDYHMLRPNQKFMEINNRIVELAVSGAKRRGA